MRLRGPPPCQRALISLSASTPGISTGEDHVEHLAGVADLRMAVAAYEAAVLAKPGNKITLRHETRVMGKIGSSHRDEPQQRRTVVRDGRRGWATSVRALRVLRPPWRGHRSIRPARRFRAGRAAGHPLAGSVRGGIDASVCPQKDGGVASSRPGAGGRWTCFYFHLPIQKSLAVPS